MTGQIELGRKVRCKVSGVEGVATARTMFLNGCARITVQPPVGKESKLPDSIWVDEPMCEYVGKTKVDPGPAHQRGGPTEKVKTSAPPSCW